MMPLNQPIPCDVEMPIARRLMATSLGGTFA